MNPLVFSLIAFGLIFGGMLLGMVLRAVLPEHHLSDDSRDVVKLGTGMIATLAALVLGLLIASAKGNFDIMNNGLVQTGSKIILLSRVMSEYGSETKEAQGLLRRGVASAIDQIWPNERVGPIGAKTPDVSKDFGDLQNQIWQLSPQNDAQRWLKSRALQLSGDMAEERSFFIEQRGHTSLPRPLLVILVSWLVFIFFCFGMLSPRNATVIAVMLVCALSAAAALFMILELDNPLGGLITVSSAPLRNALVHLGL